MWWFLAIVFVAAVLLWQIPAVGPVLSIAFVVGLCVVIGWMIKSAPQRRGSSPPAAQDATALRERTERAKADSRTRRSTIRISVDPTKATPENLERLRREREQHDRVYTNRIEAARIAGEIEGKHYTEWHPLIEQFKREGKLEEALALCLDCIDATERQARVDGLGLPRGYTRNAAIIYRKLKDFEGEVAILERFITAGGTSPEIKERLVKARTLREKKRGSA